MKLEMYGHYYRMFKGTGGVPTKVTVVGIEGDTVTLVRGHYTKEDFEERSEDLDEAIRLFCLTKMKCNKDKILTSLTPKQQRLVEKDRRTTGSDPRGKIQIGSRAFPARSHERRQP